MDTPLSTMVPMTGGPIPIANLVSLMATAILKATTRATMNATATTGTLRTIVNDQAHRKSSALMIATPARKGHIEETDHISALHITRLAMTEHRVAMSAATGSAVTMANRAVRVMLQHATGKSRIGNHDVTKEPTRATTNASTTTAVHMPPIALRRGRDGTITAIAALLPSRESVM